MSDLNGIPKPVQNNSHQAVVVDDAVAERK